MIKILLKMSRIFYLMLMTKPRIVTIHDKDKIIDLYKAVAKNKGGIARSENEITEEYILSAINKTIENGIGLLIEVNQQIVAEIHCYKLVPDVFKHILSELTIVVHPDYQGKGLGKLLFAELLTLVETHRKDILRVELIARESNTKAIEFYKTLGFSVEGKMSKRINNGDGNFEADMPMAWFNSKFNL